MQACRDLDKGIDFWVAYDRNPRLGGKPIAHVKPLDIYHENTRDMPDSDYRAEGLEFFETALSPDERALLINRLAGPLIGHGPHIETMHDLFEQWREAARDVWVVRFERLEVLHAVT
jgi:hypothetical protein